MANTFELISSSTVGVLGATDITFSSIPGTYKDLVIVVNGTHSNTATANLKMLPVNSLKLRNHLPPRKNRPVSFARTFAVLSRCRLHWRCSTCTYVSHTRGAAPALLSPTPEVQHLLFCCSYQRCSTCTPVAHMKDEVTNVNMLPPLNSIIPVKTNVPSQRVVRMNDVRKSSSRFSWHCALKLGMPCRLSL